VGMKRSDGEVMNELHFKGATVGMKEGVTETWG